MHAETDMHTRKLPVAERINKGWVTSIKGAAFKGLVQKLSGVNKMPVLLLRSCLNK